LPNEKANIGKGLENLAFLVLGQGLVGGGLTPDPIFNL
jgi:hypothetical protein